MVLLITEIWKNRFEEPAANDQISGDKINGDMRKYHYFTTEGLQSSYDKWEH